MIPEARALSTPSRASAGCWMPPRVSCPVGRPRSSTRSGRPRGAAAGVFVADYSLRRLQQVDVTGPVGVPHLMAGTIAGRAFTSGEVIVSRGPPDRGVDPARRRHRPDRAPRARLRRLGRRLSRTGWERVVAVFVLVLVAKSRYSDLWVRARRSEPLSAAAEVQWDLLPPLSCSTAEVAVGGILEPAYEIGGDSFDYAFNGAQLEFAIVDAIGHGMSAVLMSAAAINSLRSSRRTGLDLVAAYHQADQLIETHFGAVVLRHRPVRFARPPDRRPHVGERRTRPAHAGAQRHLCRRVAVPAVDAPRTRRPRRRGRDPASCSGATACCSTRTGSPSRGRPTVRSSVVTVSPTSSSGPPSRGPGRRDGPATLGQRHRLRRRRAERRRHAAPHRVPRPRHPGPEVARLGNRRARPSRRNSRPGARAGRVPSRRRSVAQSSAGVSCRPMRRPMRPAHHGGTATSEPSSRPSLVHSCTHGRGFRHGHRS